MEKLNSTFYNANLTLSLSRFYAFYGSTLSINLFLWPVNGFIAVYLSPFLGPNFTISLPLLALRIFFVELVDENNTVQF